MPFDIGVTTRIGLAGGLNQPAGRIHTGIRHLMLNPGDGEGAFETAGRWAERLGNAEVREWIDLAEINDAVGYHPSAGFVKYGFVHAFRHLKNKSSYLDALFETLSGGGDTDTNACIVGGLVGAYQGEEGIAAPMKDALLRCDTEKGRRRPEFLQTRIQLPVLLHSLIE